MADLTKTLLVDYAALSEYDSQLKQWVKDNGGDSSIKTVAVDSSVRKVYFYTEKATDVTVGATSPAYTVDLSDIDTSMGDLTTLKTTAKGSLVAAINENKDAIDTLNGADTVAGSVAKSVKDAIEALDTTADVTIASETGDVVTLKAGIAEVDGKIQAGSGADITLAKVAKTGKSTDLEVETGTGLTSTDVQAALKELKDDIDDVADDLGDVSTITVETASGVKATDVVVAVNKLKEDLDAANTAGVVKVSEAATPETGYLKTYEIAQGKKSDGSDNIVGKINIPKDFICKSGSVVKDPAGQPAGTYIALVINTKDESETDSTIYINVADLCDVYTPQASATQIQLAISATNEISAEIVDGSVDSDALADDAVTSGKIADDAVLTDAIKDAQVTAAKLATDSIAATVDGTSGTVSSTTMDATTVGLLQKAHDAVQASDLQLCQKTDIDKLFATT